MAAAAVAEAATSAPLAVRQHQAKGTRVVIAEQVRPNSVALAAVALVEQESMAKHLLQRVAQGFHMTHFSTLAVAAAAAAVLHPQAAAAAWVATVETVHPARKLEAMERHRVEVAAVAREPMLSELARQAETVLMA